MCGAETGTSWRDVGQGLGGGDPATPAGQPVPWRGLRKLWARLRFAGVRTSRRRVLRLMREHGLLAHQRTGRPHGSRAHDGRITTKRVDVMWGSDLTSVMTGEGQAAVFIAVDHCSAECVGLHASRSADRFEALEAGQAGGARAFRHLRQERGQRPRPSPRSRLSVCEPPLPGRDPLPRHRSSPAFVREPEGNGCAERFIRVLKENLLGSGVSTPSRSCAWRSSRSSRPKPELIIERHGYRTPPRSAPFRSARRHGRISETRCLRTVDR